MGAARRSARQLQQESKHRAQRLSSSLTSGDNDNVDAPLPGAILSLVFSRTNDMLQPTEAAALEDASARILLLTHSQKSTSASILHREHTHTHMAARSKLHNPILTSPL